MAQAPKNQKIKRGYLILIVFIFFIPELIIASAYINLKLLDTTDIEKALSGEHDLALISSTNLDTDIPQRSNYFNMSFKEQLNSDEWISFPSFEYITMDNKQAMVPTMIYFNKLNGTYWPIKKIKLKKSNGYGEISSLFNSSLNDLIIENLKSIKNPAAIINTYYDILNILKMRQELLIDLDLVHLRKFSNLTINLQNFYSFEDDSSIVIMSANARNNWAIKIHKTSKELSISDKNIQLFLSGIFLGNTKKIETLTKNNSFSILDILLSKNVNDETSQKMIDSFYTDINFEVDHSEIKPEIKTKLAELIDESLKKIELFKKSFTLP